jgi:hypothetical protein
MLSITATATTSRMPEATDQLILKRIMARQADLRMAAALREPDIGNLLKN